ncbi:MAG: tyrosine-type recombinase/integrase [Parvularculaceae bacterium]
MGTKSARQILALRLQVRRQAEGARDRRLSGGDARAGARGRRKGPRPSGGGQRPGRAEKAEKQAIAARAVTFRDIALEYLARLRKEGRASSTISKNEWLLDFAYPDIGDRPIIDIKPAHVLEALRKVEARGRLESARRLRSTIGSVFRYAVATARAELDPTVALQGALLTPRVKPRAAITEPRALGGILRAIDGFDGQPTIRAALQLMPILFPRPGELRLSEWNEFDFEKGVWTIPAAKMKMRRPHHTPLPPQAIEIQHALRRISGGALVFPGLRSAERAISDGAMIAALRRMGYGADEVCPHGFCATASTLLNESGKWHPDAIERQLACESASKIDRFQTGENQLALLKF